MSVFVLSLGSNGWRLQTFLRNVCNKPSWCNM